MDAPLANEAAKLYALPPEEFTKARNARAKKLRADDADLAGTVAKLPKPTVAAAAVNRLARDQPSEVRELIQAGKRLRDAQERAVAGKGGPDDLQRALADHRAALDRVQREARRLRLSEPVLERVGRTIRAASIDPELQPALARGVIAQEIEAAGFGLDPGLVVTARPKRGVAQRDRGQRDGGEAKRQKTRERLEAAEQALAELEDEARRAEAELQSAEKAVAAARRKVERAEADVESARRAL